MVIVFFCSPKGSETYGLVKLGGLEQASTLQTFDMESLDMESLKDFPTLHTEDIPPVSKILMAEE